MLLRQIKVLREENPNFCSGKLMETCDISSKQVSNRTVRRLLHKNGFGYRQSRKKGVLTRQDIKKRYMYAREVKKKQQADFWTSKIHFYLDGVSFYYKRNPAGQARAPQGRIWRSNHEGLAFGCTARGRKEGSGGKVVKLFVTISHNKGVIGCDPYDKLDGPFFEKYVREQFPKLFGKANKTGSRLCVQDGHAQNYLQIDDLRVAPLAKKVNVNWDKLCSDVHELVFTFSAADELDFQATKQAIHYLHWIAENYF